MLRQGGFLEALNRCVSELDLCTRRGYPYPLPPAGHVVTDEGRALCLEHHAHDQNRVPCRNAGARGVLGDQKEGACAHTSVQHLVRSHAARLRPDIELRLAEALGLSRRCLASRMPAARGATS